MKKWRLYKTREGARRAWAKLEPIEGYVDEYKKKAAESLKREAESFERCDTDGFVSQWCHRISAGGEESKHEIALHGGKDLFRVLVDIETGKLVSTKCFTFTDRYSYGTRNAWLVKWNGSDGTWINDYRTEKSFAKKGVKIAWIVAPAYVSTTDPLDRTPPKYGFSGLDSVRYMTLLDRKEAGLEI